MEKLGEVVWESEEKEFFFSISDVHKFACINFEWLNTSSLVIVTLYIKKLLSQFIYIMPVIR